MIDDMTAEDPLTFVREVREFATDLVDAAEYAANMAEATGLTPSFQDVSHSRILFSTLTQKDFLAAVAYMAGNEDLDIEEENLTFEADQRSVRVSRAFSDCVGVTVVSALTADLTVPKTITRTDLGPSAEVLAAMHLAEVPS